MAGWVGFCAAPPAGAIQVSRLDGPRGLLAPCSRRGTGSTRARPQSSASSHPTATRGTLCLRSTSTRRSRRLPGPPPHASDFSESPFDRVPAASATARVGEAAEGTGADRRRSRRNRSDSALLRSLHGGAVGVCARPRARRPRASTAPMEIDGRTIDRILGGGKRWRRPTHFFSVTFFTGALFFGRAYDSDFDFDFGLDFGDGLGSDSRKAASSGAGRRGLPASRARSATG